MRRCWHSCIERGPLASAYREESRNLLGKRTALICGPSADDERSQERRERQRARKRRRRSRQRMGKQRERQPQSKARAASSDSGTPCFPEWFTRRQVIRREKPRRDIHGSCPLPSDHYRGRGKKAFCLCSSPLPSVPTVSSGALFLEKRKAIGPKYLPTL